jgi:hypothetical protein
MRKTRFVMLLAALAAIGLATLACTTPGAAAPTPTDFVMVPGGTEPSATGALAPNQPTATTAPLEPLATGQTDEPGLSSKVQEILAFYPLAKGAVWTYQATFDMAGASPGDDHAIWTGAITATVTEASVEQSFPVFRLDWSDYPDVFAFEFATQYDVIRDAGIYQAATEDKARELARSPVFAETAYMGWPLTSGGQWGDPQMLANHDGRYVWVVEAAGTVTVPAGTFEGCYKATMLTNPDTTLRWFCPGRGLVRYEYHHHGTINDQVWELAAFTPGTN